MKYKVFIFSDSVLNGEEKFSFDEFFNFCLKNLVEISSLSLEKFDIDKEFIKDGENLLVFCNNKNLDNLIIKNIHLLGSKKSIIDEQIAIFDKAGIKVIFMPLESKLDLLGKAFVRDENKKYCQFHLFGLSKTQIEERLNRLKSKIDGFDCKYDCQNLLCNLVISYNGQLSLIDDNMVLINNEFKENVYSENDMLLPEIVVKMLKLKDKTLAIVENITGGRLIESLLSGGDNSFLKSVWIENIDAQTSEQLCEKVEEYKNKSHADVVLIMQGKFTDEGLLLNFAISENEEIHIYKSTFKADKNSSIEMAKNAILFHLAKKLRQNQVMPF